MRHITAKPGRLITAVAGSILIPFVTGCTAVHVSVPAGRAAGTRSGFPAAPATSPPVSKDALRRLPNGMFYALAGADPASFNLWEFSNSGEEVQLTHNASGYGISSFGASPAGIVVADASSGMDQIARLTPHGSLFVGQGRGSGPTINADGMICYVRPPYGASPYFSLMVARSFGASARAVYRQQAGITANVWGPHQSVAIISGGHAPGASGPYARLIIIGAQGKTAVRTEFDKSSDQLSNVLWNEGQGALALNSWNGGSEVLYASGRHLSLPSGWLPLAWNQAGSELLVRTQGLPSSIGIWSSKEPRSVRVLGALPRKTLVGQVVWLAQAARI